VLHEGGLAATKTLMAAVAMMASLENIMTDIE